MKIRLLPEKMIIGGLCLITLFAVLTFLGLNMLLYVLISGVILFVASLALMILREIVRDALGYNKYYGCRQ